MICLHSGVGNGKKQFCNPRQGNVIFGDWCLDNDCFNGPFKKDKFDAFIKRNAEKKSACLFLVMPDCIGNPVRTMELWNEYACQYSDWPLAFVAQDGQESRPFPPITDFDVLFIGGSTEWKMSEGAIQCIMYALSKEKHIHIGRVNSYKRYKHFADLDGSKEFTYDGTKQRFMGSERAVAEYESYEKKHRDYISSQLFIDDSIG